MLRPARHHDVARIDAFLAQHAETSMFLRSNISAHGVRGSRHPHSTSVLLHEEDGVVRSVFGLTRNGLLMCQMDDAETATLGRLASAWRGRWVQGMTGSETQVMPVLEALGISADMLRVNRIEPLMAVGLEAFGPEPDCAARLVCAQDEAILRDWYYDLELDTGLGVAGDALRVNAAERAKSAVRGRDTCVLLEGGAPVAMSSLNAKVADLVQVGGVFVPKEKRSAGLGRRVVEAQLTMAQKDGATRAILFAANAAAVRAYEAIGFRIIGGYRIALLQENFTLGDGRS